MRLATPDNAGSGTREALFLGEFCIGEISRLVEYGEGEFS
jgi:hypothetical protein